MTSSIFGQVCGCLKTFCFVCLFVCLFFCSVHSGNWYLSGARKKEIQTCEQLKEFLQGLSCEGASKL